MSNILLRITADRAEAKAELDAQAAQVDEFGKKKATAQIRVDAEQAKRDIAEVVAEAKLIPKEETIRIRVAGDQAKLQELQARMRGLESGLQNSIDSGGNTDRIVAQMGNVARQIDTVKTRIVSAGEEFERLGQDGERASVRITSALTKLRSGLGDLLSHVPLIGGLLKGAIDAVGEGLQKVVGMLPEAAQGFAGVVSAGLSLAAIGPIVLVIVAAFGALVVSLGEALIGIAALGVAFLAVLAPIAAIVAAVVIKLKDAYQAQQNLTQALDQQKQAVIALRQAEQNESQQRLAALQAEKDAVLALHDAENSVADARLGVQSAILGVGQAKLALAQFKQQLTGFGMSPSDLEKRASNVDVAGNFGQVNAGASSTAWQQMLLQYKELVLAVAQAEQQRKDATQGVADATNNLAKAQQTEEQFTKRGLQGYQAYADAINQVATAALALRTANAALLKDQHHVAASDGVLKVFDRFKKSLSELFGPAVKAAFKGLGEAFNILGRGLKPLEPALKLLGSAVGKAFVQWATDLTNPSTENALKRLITNAAKFVGPFVKLLDRFMLVLTDVANAAMPSLLGLVQKLGNEFADAARHPQKISEFIQKCIGQTKNWWHVIEDVAGALGKLAGTLNTIVGLVKDVLVPFKAIGQGLATVGNTLFGSGDSKITAQGNLQNAMHALYVRDMQALQGAKGAYRAQILAQMKSVGLTPGHDPGQAFSVYGRGHPAPLGHAAGGVTVGPVMGLFGEAGSEAILPLTNSMVMNQLGASIARSVSDNLLRLVPSPARFAGVGNVTPGVMGGVVHNHNWHLNQGDTIGSAEHFSGVVAARLRSLGMGRRGA